MPQPTQPQHCSGGDSVESIRTLYRSSQVPSLLMLLCSIASVWVLRDSAQFALLSIWAIFIISLATLRFFAVYLFERADADQQSATRWYIVLLAGACVSGLTLSIFASVFIPEVAFTQQAVLLGLVSLVAASGCIAYATNCVLFICYAATVFVPIIYVYLNADSDNLYGLGLLAVMYLVAMTATVYQVNRLWHKSLSQRLKKQQLIQTLQQAQAEADALNSKLTAEISKKHAAEQQLLAVQASLEERVSARTIELQQALEELEKSQERLQLALDASQLALWDWNVVSDEIHHTLTKNIFGLEAEQVCGVLADLRPLLHPDDLPVLRSAMIEHMKQRTDGYIVEYRIKHQDGHWVWIEDRGRAVERDADGKVLRMLGTRRDISLRRQHDEDLRLASSVFDAGNEGIVILDPYYTILAVNKAFMAVTGFDREDVVGRSLFADNLPDMVQMQYRIICAAIEKEGSWQGETIDVRKNGDIYPQSLQIHVVRDQTGKMTHIVGFFTDLTISRQAEERLNYLTQYDELTGLCNRTLFHRHLHQAVENATYNKEGVALLHINVDRFKVLNDSLGVEVADQVLLHVSRRLAHLVIGANTFARLGGDEFAIILDHSISLPNLARLAASILSNIRTPLVVAEHELIISASLGISVLSESTPDTATLQSHADIAIQHAKHLGGDNFQFYNNQLQASTLERLQLEQQLRRCIDEGQLQAYYQPKLTLADGVVHSAEALVRWNHPQRGVLSPGAFIALAEETGLITAIGEFMLHQACQQAVLWLQQGLSIRVAVNVSVGHVRQGHLVAVVQHALQASGLPAHLLELELTESQMLENPQSVITTFKQLRELGVHLAIDDFGTGYSSLSYLKRFPANSVKIDQSFIQDLVDNSEDAAITQAIITMAHGLNLRVVAEGVETQAQMDFLQAHHCDEIQGYLLAKPMPAEALTAFLLNRKLIAESASE